MSLQDLLSVDSRTSLAKLVLRFFDHWQVNEATRCNLLGMASDDLDTLRSITNE